MALIHMNARVYDPQIGKFSGADPIVGQPLSTQGWNRYAYVGGNPLNRTDPTGMDDDGIGDDSCFDDGCVDLFAIEEIVVTGKQRAADNDASTSVVDTSVSPKILQQMTVIGKLKPPPPPPLTPAQSYLSQLDDVYLQNEIVVTASRRQITPPVLSQSNQQACQLVAPAGSFTSSPGTIAQFQPTFADSLGAAILNLNQLGITPVMTDGFRTADMQSARVAAASSGLSPFGAASGISAHQVGMAADFGINSNAPNNLTVYNTMVTQGLQNGAGFHPSDPVHFQDPEARQNQTAAMASSCSAAYAAGGHH